MSQIDSVHAARRLPAVGRNFAVTRIDADDDPIGAPTQQRLRPHDRAVPGGDLRLEDEGEFVAFDRRAQTHALTLCGSEASEGL